MQHSDDQIFVEIHHNACFIYFRVLKSTDSEANSNHEQFSVQNNNVNQRPRVLIIMMSRNSSQKFIVSVSTSKVCHVTVLKKCRSAIQGQKNFVFDQRGNMTDDLYD